jgi:hypothetical protein
MTASHGLECLTYMVPLSTGSQHPRCSQKHQADVESNGTDQGWELAGEGTEQRQELRQPHGVCGRPGAGRNHGAARPQRGRDPGSTQ